MFKLNCAVTVAATKPEIYISGNETWLNQVSGSMTVSTVRRFRLEKCLPRAALSQPVDLDVLDTSFAVAEATTTPFLQSGGVPPSRSLK